MTRIKPTAAIGIVWAAALLFAVSAHAQSADFALAFAPSGTWTFTGSLPQAREEQTATLIPFSGKVLVAGGAVNGVPLVSSALYDPTTGKWTATGKLHIARASAAALFLNNGLVLVAGGCTNNCLDATSTAELYNPATGTWKTTGSLSTARAFLTLTKLSTGLVLAAGGCTALNINGCTADTNTAEIYNPATGLWAHTAAMRAGRATHTATLLANGVVLVAGGANGAGDPLASSELFTVAKGWTLTAGRMNSAHAEHTATLLANGNVLVAGGENISGVSQNVSEIYSPATGKWTRTGGLHTSRQEHTAVRLGNGNVLVAGGTLVTATNTIILASSELFDPSTGVWTATGSLKNARTGHTATVLNNGLVLAAAGSGAVNELATAELYTP